MILLMRPVAVLLAIQDWGSPIIMKTLLGFAVMTYSLRGQRITKDMIDAINEQPEVRMLDLADCVIDDDAIASLFPINVSCIICVDDAEYDSDAFQALLYKRPYINVTELKHERTFDRYGAFYRSR